MRTVSTDFQAKNVYEDEWIWDWNDNEVSDKYHVCLLRGLSAISIVIDHQEIMISVCMECDWAKYLNTNSQRVNLNILN